MDLSKILDNINFIEIVSARLIPEFCTQIARSEVWGQVTANDLARRLLR